MLVLTRREGESLILALPTGERVAVSLEIVNGSQAKIGIAAPKSIRVLREELVEDREIAGV